MKKKEATHRIPFNRALVLALFLCLGCGFFGKPGVTPAHSEELKEPLELRSDPQKKLLDVTLEVVYDAFEVPQTTGTAVESLRVYKVLEANGVSYADSNAVGFPGPTLRVQQGDSVRIKLINSMPLLGNEMLCLDYPASESGQDRSPNCFHGPNTTNLHYHGFHVTPSGSGDNVLLRVKPAGADSTSPDDRIGAFQYAFRIPYTQAQGTHWYHPHKHGSVALQVINGMAGAFVVEGGGLDSLTAADNIEERLLVVQEIDSDLNLVGGQQGKVTLINGQYSPVISMKPGEVQRWRIVNATVQLRDNYKLFFQDDPNKEEPTFYAIARDGVQYAPKNYDHQPDTAIVSPGNRLDAFVKAPPDTGSHELEKILIANLHVSAFRMQMEMAQLGKAFLRVAVNPTTDENYATELPRTLPELPSYLNNLSSTGADTAAYVIFSETGKAGDRDKPPQFYIGKPDSVEMQYNPNAAPFLSMPLNTTQTWKVMNYSSTAAFGNGINHPFHIHVNPFQVIQVVAPRGGTTGDDPNRDLYIQLNDAAAKGFPIWMDTIALPLADPNDPEKNPGYVVIRHRFEEFSGKFVMHCHILGHEERGMMQLVEIVK